MTKKTMRSLAIVAAKGGCSKSTTVVHLAVEAARSGERVLVLDCDPQRSCVTWAGLRDREHPTVEGIEPSAVPQRLERAASEGFSYVFVDTAPRATGALASLLREVNFVLVPMRPSAFDVATMQQSLAIVAASETAGAIVLSACPPRVLEIEEMRVALANLSLPLCPVEIGERTAFRRAIASGRAVAEFDPRGKAADEITKLWAFVQKGMQ